MREYPKKVDGQSSLKSRNPGRSEISWPHSRISPFDISPSLAFRTLLRLSLSLPSLISRRTATQKHLYLSKSAFNGWRSGSTWLEVVFWPRSNRSIFLEITSFALQQFGRKLGNVLKNTVFSENSNSCQGSGTTRSISQYNIRQNQETFCKSTPNSFQTKIIKTRN